MDELRSVKTETRLQVEALGRAEEVNHFDPKVPAETKPRITLQRDGMLATVAAEDGTESTVEVKRPLVMEDGSWHTPPTSARLASRRPSHRGSARQAVHLAGTPSEVPLIDIMAAC